jgi:hypothetical protein
VLVATSTLLGLALANGLIKAPQARRSATTFHEQTANAGLAAIGLHGATRIGGKRWRKLHRATPVVYAQEG